MICRRPSSRPARRGAPAFRREGPLTQQSDPLGGRALAAFYGAVIFANAFLLFLVQPLIGKAILPWFGGSASVWTVCMLFFQGVLLAGYLLAHLLARHLAPRAQGLAVAALVAASLAALPIAPDASLKPAGESEPIAAILRALALSVGLPYLLLTTTSPMLQRWFAHDLPGRSPYRLFALSNAGSMIALLAYPFAIEPVIGLGRQLSLWAWGFALAAGAYALLALRRLTRAEAPGHATARGGDHGEDGARGEVRAAPLWVALGAAPSILLLAVTTQMTQNVAPVPLLWLAPLTLYLLSFILCFESERWYRRGEFLAAFAPALLLLAALPMLDLDEWPLVVLIGAYLLGAFVVFMVCHGELARARPPSRDLTRYYLFVALGGVVGGLAVAIAAPSAFDSDIDLFVGLAIAALVVAIATRRDWLGHAWTRAAVPLAAIGFAVLLWRLDDSLESSTLASARNFYGTLRIEEEGADGDPDERRQFFHGKIMHGEQFLAADRRAWPTSYYGREGGAGLAIEATRRAGTPQRVGIVGLGAGTIAVYGRPGDVHRFYEIDPLVVTFARRHFSFLADARGRVEIALGDARLVLEREAPQGYDVLVVDAFSGDAIPIHLLTEEAFGLYFKHLRPGGLLAVHVSNKFLDLAPVVRLAAEGAGWTARMVDDDGDDDEGTSGSTWVLVARDAAMFDAPLFADAIEPIEPIAGLRPWRDDYSSLFAVLRRRAADAR